MKILGFSAGAHDSSYAIFEHGRLVIHEELERVTRVKKQRQMCYNIYRNQE